MFGNILYCELSKIQKIENYFKKINLYKSKKH
uniref:Uncharacterized protein n=1 Tax=viral metagenome TaxID=1070528 RepID=A0A6C0HTC8_9ZZZZ